MIIDVLMVRRIGHNGAVLAIHIQKENINDFAITIFQGVNGYHIVIRSLGLMWWVSFICFLVCPDNRIFITETI